jgi:hypothetical protein
MGKKRGRPPKKMAEFKPSKSEPQAFSFETQSINFLHSVQYNIRKAIEDKAVELSEIKQCIDISTIKLAMTKLKLEQYGEFISDNENQEQ